MVKSLCLKSSYDGGLANSKLFEYPTIFLDIDAFLIRPVQSLFLKTLMWD